MDVETRKAAIDTIARHVLHRCVDLAEFGGQFYWGDYPDLQAVDWEAVLTRVDAIAKSIAPRDEQYQAAYEHLTVQEGQKQ